MLNLIALVGLMVQAPAPMPAAAPPGPDAQPRFLYRTWPPNDPDSLALFLAGEQQYAGRLGQALGEDLGRHWQDYAEDEEDKARDRASGDDDDDLAVQGFADYMDAKYRSRRKVGIILFGVGFAPLGFGLYTGLTLGEGRPIALAFAGVGGALIVSGAVIWGVRDSQLRSFRQIRAALAGRPQARLKWRGVAPMYDAHSRTHGISLSFAF